MTIDGYLFAAGLGLGLVFVLIAVWLILRAADGTGPALPRPIDWVRPIKASFRAIRYLVTNTKWKYAAPWYLVIGPTASGKTSFGRSLEARGGQRRLLSKRPEIARGTTFVADHAVFFEHEQTAVDAEGIERDWVRFLQDLDNERPKKPLDGIVLFVPAVALDADELGPLAETLAQRLFSIEKLLAYSLPVYVVVNRTDEVEGFAEYWAAFGDERRREIFGLSASTSNPRTLFDPDEQSSLVAEVGDLRHRMTSLRAVVTRDGYLFPTRVETLLERLELLLRNVFAENVYQSRHVVQGAYFVGSIAANGVVVDDARTDLDFIDDLVERKIAPERHLGTPLNRGIWSRNPGNRLFQKVVTIAFAAFLLFFFWQGYQVYRHSTVLEKSAARIDAIVESVTDRQNSSDGATGMCIGRVTTIELLEPLSEIRPNWTFLSIAPSWIFGSGLSEDHAAELASDTYEAVLFPNFECHLSRKVDALAAELLEHPDPRVVSARPAFDALLDGYADLHVAVIQFRKLSRQGDHAPEDRQKYVAFLRNIFAQVYERPLPERLLGENSLANHALAEVAYDEGIDFAKPRMNTIEVLLETQASELLANVPPDIASSGALFGSIGEGGAGSESALVDLESWVSWVESDWLDKTVEDNPCFDIRNGIGGTFDRVREALLGAADGDGQSTNSPDGDVLRDEAQRCAKASFAAAAKLRWGEDSVFSTDPTLRFAPGAATRVESLGRVARLPFIRAEGAAALDCGIPSETWSRSSLIQVRNFVQTFADYLDTRGIEGRSDVFAADARIHLDAGVTNVLNGQALHNPSLASAFSSPSGVERALYSSSRHVLRSGPILLQILGELGAVETDSLQHSMAACVNGFVQDRLRAANALFEIQRTYRVRFGAGESLFDLGDAAAAKAYVLRQTAEASQIASYVDPVINLHRRLAKPLRVDTELTERWRATQLDLVRYQQFGDDDAQIAKLNTFIEKVIAPLDASNCRQKLATSATPTDAVDVFSSRYAKLHRIAEFACNEDSAVGAFAALETFVTAFNNTLARHYPFSNSTVATLRPTTVRSFVLEEAAPDVDAGTVDEVTSTFLGRYAGAAEFLRSNLAHPEGIAPLKIDVAFRPDGTQPGTDQVFSWSVASRADEARLTGPDQSLEWVFGDPLTFEVIWADTSSFAPDATASRGALDIEGRTARFSFGGSWALMEMIDAHRREDSKERLSLDFDVPVRAADGSTADPARFTIGITISGQDPDKPIGSGAWSPVEMPDFPTLGVANLAKGKSEK